LRRKWFAVLSSWLPEKERAGLDFKAVIRNLIYQEL
jgi:hypothetical protein